MYALLEDVLLKMDPFNRHLRNHVRSRSCVVIDENETTTRVSNYQVRTLFKVIVTDIMITMNDESLTQATKNNIQRDNLS